MGTPVLYSANFQLLVNVNYIPTSARRAHIYDTDWNLIASLNAVEPEENGQFGEHVAIGARASINRAMDF